MHLYFSTHRENWQTAAHCNTGDCNSFGMLCSITTFLFEKYHQLVVFMATCCRCIDLHSFLFGGKGDPTLRILGGDLQSDGEKYGCGDSIFC